MPTLGFKSGTLELRGLARGALVPPAFRWDDRADCFRAPAIAYADVIAALLEQGLAVDDSAPADAGLPAGSRVHREPRPFQSEAVLAWTAAKGRGVVVLPTGAGKTHVAVMAIEATRRSTLVVAPTLDLVRQWYDLLRATFGGHVGVVGGGEHDVQPLTVTTYDSAYLHMEHLGNRFALVVFDECHHLPGPAYGLVTCQARTMSTMRRCSTLKAR